MNVKEKLIERGKGAPKRSFDITTLDGDTLTFNLPYGGLERATYRRKRSDFVELHKDKPSAVWVQKGLLPEAGYGADELGLIFDLHYLCDQNWTQEDVLEMFAVNDIELIAIGAALGKQVLETMGKDSLVDIETKKPSTPEEAPPTGGSEAA